MKKILSLVLALLMMISCISMIAAEDTAITDETETAEEETPYDFAIEFLTNYGIYKGGEPATADIQRYQMALFVARIATGWTDDATWEDGSLNSSEFTDIDTAPANLYYGAMSYANQKGYIEGYGDGKFGPYDGITYQDALTMLVRVLGWNNLRYPWGYIEQAIKLGLTDGIEGVAYTDTLTRAEVAQLVYNALFIEGKDGMSLAYKSFNMEDGWQTVIITASDRSSYDNNDANCVGATKVGFRVLNEDGSLGNTQYVANASELGLDYTTHEPEQYLGYVYSVIFEHNDRNLAQVKAYKSLYLNTVWNMGRTNNEGKVVSVRDIEAFLAKQKLVSKYSDDEYYYGTGFATDEFILISAETTYGTTTVKTDKAQYGINETTGDIVKLAWNGDVATIAEVVWYYNAILDTYFKNEVVNGTVHTHYMTEEDYDALPALLKEVITVDVATANRYSVITSASTVSNKSAYASLELFDTNGDEVADRGYFEVYYFGNITYGSRVCQQVVDANGTKCGTTINTYTFTNIGNEPTTHAETSYVCDLGGCAHSGLYWLNSESVIAKGKSAIGMYKYDTTTGEIKVIKTVEDRATTSDADTFTSRGLVRAWSTLTGRISLVDDLTGKVETYGVAYVDLLGYQSSGVPALVGYENAFATKMEALFMNYVNYTVVDGVLVSISLSDNWANDVIIVDEYLGIDRETNLMTVAGYDTKTFKRKTYKLLTVDSWEAGDWNYTTNSTILETMAQAFDLGAVLVVTSTDKETGAYNVDLLGKYENGVFTLDTTSGLNNEAISLDFTGAAQNMYKKNGSWQTSGLADQEVIIIMPYSNGHTTVVKYDDFGEAQDGWKISGTKINYEANRHVIIPNPDSLVGFGNKADVKVSVVHIRDYIGSSNTVDSDIMGATTSEYSAWDMLTESLIVVTATNMKLEVGSWYLTHDDVVICHVNDAIGEGETFIDILIDAYGLNSARYGDGQRYVLFGVTDTTANMPVGFENVYINKYVIPVYAQNEFAKLAILYGEGTEMYTYFYNRLFNSFYEGYDITNSENVYLMRLKYNSAHNWWFYKSTEDGKLDLTFGGSDGFNIGSLSSANENRPWNFFTNVWSYHGDTHTIYMLIDTTTGRVIMIGDVSQYN